MTCRPSMASSSSWTCSTCSSRSRTSTGQAQSSPRPRWLSLPTVAHGATPSAQAGARRRERNGVRHEREGADDHDSCFPRAGGRLRRPGAIAAGRARRRWRPGGLDAAVDLLTRAVEAGGVIQAFGTGHSEAFAMEIAGRAGGLIPTNKIALRDIVLRRQPADERPGGGPPWNATRQWSRSSGPLADRAGRRLRHRLQLRGQRLRRRAGDPGQAEGPRRHRSHLAPAHPTGRAQTPERSTALRRR